MLVVEQTSCRTLYPTKYAALDYIVREMSICRDIRERASAAWFEFKHELEFKFETKPPKAKKLRTAQAFGSRAPVHVSADMGETWTVAEGTCVLVVVPGAGSHYNEKAYSKIRESHEVVTRDTPTRKGGFKYPKRFGNMWDYDLRSKQRWEDDSLMGLSRSIGADISSRRLVPHTVVTGSRGGQVVVPMLLKHFWRGRIVVINGGPLTTASRIPKHVNPVFITCDGDYFATARVEHIKRTFAKLSEVDGVAVHLKNQSHMPQLEENTLLNIVDALLSPSQRVTSSDIPSAQKHQLVPLEATASPRPKSVVTVLGARGGVRDAVLLRRKATKHHDFYADGRRATRGERVTAEGFETDEDGYMMVHVRNQRGLDGWLYGMNIAELSQ